MGAKRKKFIPRGVPDGRITSIVAKRLPQDTPTAESKALRSPRSKAGLTRFS